MAGRGSGVREVICTAFYEEPTAPTFGKRIFWQLNPVGRRIECAWIQNLSKNGFRGDAYGELDLRCDVAAATVFDGVIKGLDQGQFDAVEGSLRDSLQCAPRERTFARLTDAIQPGRQRKDQLFLNLAQATDRFE